jgi:catechol 2,3-dioxygenase-like lactoylglutathione lyase family enzyme
VPPRGPRVRDDGAPGPRPQYGGDYYGAFLLDPDGNSAEAVHHGSLREHGVNAAFVLDPDGNNIEVVNHNRG